MCHKISAYAFDAAADPAVLPETGAPWQPLKLYYNHTFHKDRLVALNDAMVEAGLESPYAEWLANWEDRPEDADRLTTRVPCAEYFGTRDAALIAHATQVDPDGRWFHVPLDLQQRVWPTEDFQLARSHVETTLPEDDLFAGIR
jgi:mycothiol S-conjugate amidase